MYKRLILPFLLAAISLSPIDYDRALILRVEGLMNKSSSTKSYTYQGKGWFEFTDETGLKWQRNFGDARTHGGLKPRKIISIDLRILDTTAYSHIFQELTVVHIGNASRPPIGSFIGIDSLCELTGQLFIQGAGDYTWMYKKNNSSYNFNLNQKYDYRFSAFGVDDIDLNGAKEIVGDSLGSILTFESITPDGLNLRLKHFWFGRTGSAQAPRIADLDGDGYPEITIHQFGNGLHGTRIVKYDSASRQLKNAFQITYPNNPGFRGYWAIGDFDLDGKKEFVTANMSGEVYFVEHVQGDTSYAISFSDTTRYINAFFHAEGNDLDGDGRPECFIGSDNTSGLNNIAVYERTGNDRFEVSAWIELFPLGGLIWEWIWTGEVTGDGKDDIVLTSGNTLVILGAFGDDEYRVLWYKRYSSGISHRLFDIDNDGIKEILLSFIDSNGIHMTKILVHKRVVSVGGIVGPSSIKVSVYPNPAITTAIVSITGAERDLHRIVVCTMSGHVVFETQVDTQPGYTNRVAIPVEHLSSGIYYVSVINLKSPLTSKLLVLR